MNAKGGSGGGTAPWIGPAIAIVGVLGFSFKAILIKLAYACAPIDAVTLLALRMIYATPFFCSWPCGQREVAVRHRGHGETGSRSSGSGSLVTTSPAWSISWACSM
jgi:hypothetical protein